MTNKSYRHIFMALLLILSQIGSTEAQSLTHTRDLIHTFSPTTLGKFAISLQGSGLSNEDGFSTRAGFGFGLGKYMDVLAAYHTISLNPDDISESVAFGLKIGDPPLPEPSLWPVSFTVIPIG